MVAPLWVVEVAAAFWERTRSPASRPQDLRRAIARTLPITVVPLPELRVAGVDQWLREHGGANSGDTPDRPLRACLVARDGQGFIFLDRSDPEDEQRFSLAHELSHFLNDYERPRTEAARRLGPVAIEIVEGMRPARPDEDIRALLAGIRLSAFCHFMERDEEGAITSGEVDSVERAADLLALELLAPAHEVMQYALEIPVEGRRPALTSLLVTRYGLPEPIAASYAGRFAPKPDLPHPLLRRLGLV
jgi:hypothetical protein